MYFCPKNLVAGFQKRGNVNLSFITYIDEKKKQLCSAKSWEGWRDQSIDPQAFENTPMSGFVVNKNVKRDSHFGGNEYIRVWHPLNFEFEISISNFERLFNFIDTSKGEILTPCVLGWSSGQKVQLISTLDPYFEDVVENPAYGSIDKKDLALTSFNDGQVYDFKGETVVCIGEGKVIDADMPFYTASNGRNKNKVFYHVKNKSLEILNTRVKYLRETDVTLSEDEIKDMHDVLKQCFVRPYSYIKSNMPSVADNPKKIQCGSLCSYEVRTKFSDTVTKDDTYVMLMRTNATIYVHKNVQYRLSNHYGPIERLEGEPDRTNAIFIRKFF